MIKQGLQEQEEFIKEWPIQRLESLTIDEYTNLNKTSFTYWLEAKTSNTGSIWGGSSFKFGVYQRRNLDSWSERKMSKTDGKYGWLAKYGNTAEEAFDNIKKIILSIIKSSVKHEIDKIDSQDMGDAVKWKIAFLYNKDHLIPIFSREMLIRSAESHGLKKSRNKKASELQNFLLTKKPREQSTLEFASILWSQFSLDNFYYVLDKFITQAQSDNLKRRGFPSSFKDLSVKVSFGTGNTARIPWIAFLKDPNTVTNGIYPVYLYYKEVNTLILSYGISETKESENRWPDSDQFQTISDWYLTNHNQIPYRYGSSYIKAIYDLDEELDAQLIQKDLDDIIDYYKSIEFKKPDFLAEDKSSPETKVWLVAPGEGASKWEDFYNEGVIGLGWNKVTDLNKFYDREAIRQFLFEVYPNESKTHMNNSLALWEFRDIMKPGDVVITKKGLHEYLGYGIVESDYYYENDKEFPHLRKVSWKKKGNWADHVGQIVLKTLTDITKYPEYVERLKRQIGIGQEAVIPDKINYWWINANPKYWKIEDFEVGQEQAYTTYNEKGNKRSRFEYFHKVKDGDLMIGYETSPIKKVVAIFEITKGVHIDEDDGEEKISFTILKFLPDPISWAELKEMPELQSCEVLKNNQGSLFKLTSSEFDSIISKEIEVEYPEYTMQNALSELFIYEDQIEAITNSLEYKRNIILQGPPGTGKSYMAKKIAYLIIGEKDHSKIEMVQFHQSYAYEDFIQGFRPTETGNFKLQNGVFYRFCKRAQADQNKKYFFIIDEINRGNLSKVFGELMLLIEKDKRGIDSAVTLTYAKSNAERFFIPENVYLIGTMNTADRSLAVVDYALRRRFAFISIMPVFNDKFKNHLIDGGVDEGIVEKVVTKINYLNTKISEDNNLGKGFQIGHSYFCNFNENNGDQDWYDFIIKHEIGPMLDEYWFDNEEISSTHINNLLD